MDQRRYRRKTRVLWALTLLALAFIALLSYLHTLTGRSLLDGAIGVLLGLYICSHPAANAVDLLFFERGALREIASGWSGIGWLALNMLVLLLGCAVIISGTTRFARVALP